MKAVQINATGGPETLHLVDLPEPEARPGAVVVQVAAAGLNFIDTYHRTGLYPVEFPFTPGLEGAGTVVAVGEGVEGLAPGDRVAWATGAGSYAEQAVVSAEVAVPVPAAVELEAAAAVMLQGMTAHYLALDTFPLSAGDRCLIHAGAGGVGLLLIQIAKVRGAEVFTTVGSGAKARVAKDAGADHVIRYEEEDFADAVERIAGPRPLDVVYDGVGRAVFDKSLGLLRARGMMVTYGNASGAVDPVSPLALSSAGSLFLTRPTLFHHVASREELERRAGDLFAWIASGDLDVRIGARIPLAEAASAHRMLEGRETTGKVLLIP